jgi:hypothetical protein
MRTNSTNDFARPSGLSLEIGQMAQQSDPDGKGCAIFNRRAQRTSYSSSFSVRTRSGLPGRAVRSAIAADNGSKRLKHARNSYSEIWLRSLPRLLRQLFTEEPPI